MKTFRVINDDGDIEICIFKKANIVFHTDEYDETEETCVYREKFNIFDLVTKYEKLQQENEKLKEQSLVAQTNEETFRLEMEEVTKTLGLDEDTIFDDVKASVRNLKDDWNKLKEHLKEKIADGRSNEHLWLMGCYDEDKLILEKMEELERGSDSE